MNELFAPAFRFPGGSVLARQISREPAQAYLVTARADSPLITALSAAAVCLGTEGKPCGCCRGCRKAASGQHPDIETLQPEKDRKTIGVDQIRSLRAAASMLPGEAPHKVWILPDADALNDHCQNALLKLLEEPPAGAVFLLCCANPGKLLPTVRSRCVTVQSVPECETADPTEAETLVDVLTQGPLTDLVRFLYAHFDKSKGTDPGELLRSAHRVSVRRLGEAEAAGRSGQTLHAAAQLLAKAITYTESNVSPGHVAGLLLAGGTEMRNLN